MIGARSLWAGSALAAGAAHGAGAALLVWMATPDPVEQAPALAGRLELAVMDVPRAEATPSPPDTEAADAVETPGTALSGGAVPVVSAIARDPTAVALPGEAPRVQPAPDAATHGMAVAPGPARGEPAAVTDPPETAPPFADPPAERVATSGLPAETATTGSLPDQSAAVASAPETLPLDETTARGARLDAVAGPVTSVPARSEAGMTARPFALARIIAPAIASAAPIAEGAAKPLPVATAAPRATPPSLALAEARPEAFVPAALRPSPEPAPEEATPSAPPAILLAPSGRPTGSAAIPSAAPPDIRADGEPAPRRTPPATPTAPAAPETTRTKAALAWTGGAATRLSPEALTVIDALVSGRPAESGENLRDGIGGILSSAECARVQTAFRPETGELELAGHVPDAETGARIAEAVLAEVGGAVPVVSRVRTLPPPQCTVLSALAEAGIPQSTEQFTNPLIIGKDSFARVYEFRSGDTMRLDLGGADYDGWLYLDYYDSSGRVTHLVPNELVPPVRLDAQAVATFGGGNDDIAGGRVRLVIGPPYGQDIAVAMVSSLPLFDDLRPMTEDAALYLEDVGGRVAELRAAGPDLKIEWVYLFVETAP